MQESLGIKQNRRSALAIKTQKKNREGARFQVKVETELKTRNFFKNEPQHWHSPRPLTASAQQAALMATSLKQHKFPESFTMSI